MIRFFAEGIPAPQGSKRHLGGGILVESSKRVKPWRSDVRAAAQDARGDRQPLDGPVHVEIEFRFLRPKGHFGTGRNSDKLRPAAPATHIGKPDLDKLARAILDACTGVLWVDDSQVITIVARKRYIEPPVLPGALILVDGVGA